MRAVIRSPSHLFSIHHESRRHLFALIERAHVLPAHEDGSLGWLIDATNEVEQGCLPTTGRSHDHGKTLAGNVKGDALDCRHLDISLLIDFDNVRKTDYWSACVFGFRDLSQSLRFHFCPCLSILWVKRYVPCSVTARQPWLVTVFGTPSHGL